MLVGVCHLEDSVYVHFHCLIVPRITLGHSLQEAGLFKGGKPPAFSPQDIIEFIFFPVVNEGCRVIAEGIVDKPADLDVATVLAMGFPPYRSVTQHVSVFSSTKSCSQASWASVFVFTCLHSTSQQTAQ